jgi:hypothetical protein
MMSISTRLWRMGYSQRPFGRPTAFDPNYVTSATEGSYEKTVKRILIPLEPTGVNKLPEKGRKPSERPAENGLGSEGKMNPLGQG